MEAPLVEFITYHERDEKARVARLYLALVYVETGRVFRAQALIEAERNGPPGALHDLSNIVHAAALAKAGHSEESVKVLLPMRRRIVDRNDRLLFSETLVFAALKTKRYGLALEYMQHWLSEASPQVTESAKRVIVHLLQRIPARDREGALPGLSGGVDEVSSRQETARIWLQERVRDSLVKQAVSEKDPVLAERLLKAERPSERKTEAHRRLSEVADQKPVIPRVAGRSVGLVLSLSTSLARRRSAQVARGLSRALGLPDSASNEDAVKLIVRDDGGGGVSRAMAGLASDGAAILVAGVDDESADQARSYAETASVPVILLHSPKTELRPGSNAFLLGVRRGEAARVLEQKLQSLQVRSSAQIEPEDCERRAASIEQPRFEVFDWKRRDVQALVLLGDPPCTRDVMRELTQVGLSPWIALALESSQLREEVGHHYRTLSLRAGQFPGAHTEVDEGPPSSFYELLGYDAGTLVSAALSTFPHQRIAEMQGVLRLHRLAKANLSSAQVELLTTDQRGFGGASTIERKLSVEVTGVARLP